MDKATPAVTTTPPACLGTDWFDPLEYGAALHRA
jgi:hypothetical protein